MFILFYGFAKMALTLYKHDIEMTESEDQHAGSSVKFLYFCWLQCSLSFFLRETNGRFERFYSREL